MLTINDVQRAVDPSLWRLDPCVPGLAANVGILPSQPRGYVVLESTVPTSLVPFLLEPATHGQAEQAEKSCGVRVPLHTGSVWGLLLSHLDRAACSLGCCPILL